jgi:RimJ/RimL family protein N-acetyltransferase
MLEGLLVDLVPGDRRFEEADYRWKNSEASFWTRVGDRPFFTRAMLEARRAERRERQGPRRRVGFGIQAKDGTPIGFFGINWIVPYHRLAMLGAKIGDPAYWGGGYGTDALLLVVDYAFDWLDLRKIWLMTMGLNARVVRQMEKVGFTLEGRQREATWADGAWTDILVYGLLRDEWPGRAAMIDRLGLKARD